MVTEAESKEYQSQAADYASAFFAQKKVPFEIAEVAVPLATYAFPDRFFSKAKTRWMNEKDRPTRDVLRDSLSSVRSPALAEQAMSLFFSGKFDSRETFRLLAGEPETQKTRFDVAEKNADALMKRLPGNTAGARVIGLLASGACDVASAERLETFFRPKLPQLVGGERYLEQTNERIRDCAALNARLIPQYVKYLSEKK
jgi:ERAP1-like C-terminal domain